MHSKMGSLGICNEKAMSENFITVYSKGRDYFSDLFSVCVWGGGVRACACTIACVCVCAQK